LLQSIVGPPLKGVADLASSERAKADSLKDPKKAGSDSFGQMLGAKSKETTPPRAESPPRGAIEKVSKGPPERPERDDPSEVPRGESDRKAEKLKATPENGAKKEVNGSQRQKAILKFMDSFESEFGVPPTRIVEAMANLDMSQQAASPEETADQVIDQLDLDGSDADQAKNMYVGLLAQLSQMEKTPVLPPKPEMDGGLMRERFAEGVQKRQVLNQSLDNMNEKFWMKGAAAGAATGAVAGAADGDLADKVAQMSLQEKLGQPQGLSSLNMDEPSFARNLKSALPEGATPLKDIPASSAEAPSVAKSPEAALAALVAAARAAQGQAGNAAAAEDDGEDSAPVNGGKAGALEGLQAKPSLKGEELIQQAGSHQGQGQQGFESFKQQQEGFNNQAGQSTAKGEMLMKSKLGEKADFKKLLGADGQLQPQALGQLKQDLIANVPAAGVAGAVNAAPTPGENEANVRQIMNQAQYLIKKGGGEMKVQMSPEGMGQIHMRVLVENGKVNVQMSAETAEAKKTLESGLTDLKNSLAAHKLSMDHIKIDVVNSANAENSTQNPMNQDQGGREQTRQFWNRFNENFGSPSQQRENFADIPNMRGYPRKRTDESLEPIRSASVSNYAGAGKGKGLNLVA
jgi:flagellar hook-length control protein FliK